MDNTYLFGLVSEPAHYMATSMSFATVSILLFLILYEFLMGRYKDGKKTKEDWAIGGLSLGFLATVQRPLLTLFIFFSLTALFPTYSGALRWLEVEYFWPGIVIYMLIDEYLHGRAHLFSHSRKPKNKILERIQAFYKVSHRPHHQIGGNDGKGELTAIHTYVEHWGWWLILPNYWFGLICLYLGFYELFFWGTMFKAIWGMHVHTNWGPKSYDLVLLNHKNPIISKTMYALCHVFTFPNMHHQHHSRGRNSAKNMHNFLALYDWLIYGTLKIEKEAPKRLGWRQNDKEKDSALYRFTRTFD